MTKPDNITTPAFQYGETVLVRATGQTALVDAVMIENLNENNHGPTQLHYADRS